jgi:hypothetical protein
MSKHVITTLDDCYNTQLLPVTWKVLAGFEKDETYHVKRTQLPNVPGFALDQLVKCFCPEIEQWGNEQSSAMGDNEHDRVPGGESAARSAKCRGNSVTIISISCCSNWSTTNKLGNHLKHPELMRVHVPDC